MKINRNLAIKIGIGIAAVILVVGVIGFLLSSLISTLLPVAAVAVLLYLAYRWYASRQPVKQGDTVVAKADKVEKPARTAARQPAAASVSTAAGSAETWDKEDFTAQVDRLAEKEQKLEQKKDVEINDALRAQLAERRKRLGLDD